MFDLNWGQDLHTPVGIEMYHLRNINVTSFSSFLHSDVDLGLIYVIRTPHEGILRESVSPNPVRVDVGNLNASRNRPRYFHNAAYAKLPPILLRVSFKHEPILLVRVLFDCTMSSP